MMTMNNYEQNITTSKQRRGCQKLVEATAGLVKMGMFIIIICLAAIKSYDK